MVRSNGGYALPDSELPETRDAAAALAAMGVDGLVVGYATAGLPRLDDVTRVLERAGGVRVTFHRAFDQLDDPLGAIETIEEVPAIDRILTSGGTGSAAERASMLEEYVRRARRVTIVAGGGIDDAMLSRLHDGGVVTEAHVGRAARADGSMDGPVSIERVRVLRAIADNGTTALRGSPRFSARP
jgi:copper homeostasis protein